jgi:AraC-like DNA-binding protein
LLAFTTDNYRPSDRFAAFNEEFARRIMSLDDIWQLSDAPYHGAMDARLIGPLVCTRLTSSFVGFKRATSTGLDGSVVLGIHLNGRFHLDHPDLTMDSREDFATLNTDADICNGIFEGEQLTIRIPRVVLGEYVTQQGEIPPARIRRNTPLARLMGGYLTSYLDLADNAGPELGETVGRHMVELAALAMGAKGDAREAINAGGLRAARRQAVLDAIAKGFATPGFSPEAVAHAVGISNRYLRQLLEESGASFTDLVLEHRLDSARQMLVDPAQVEKRITDIAYDAGFSDLSYFNRAFRRRYSAAPRDVRAQALGL